MTRKLFKEAFQVKEAQCTIIADKEQGVKTAMASIKSNRKALENYITRNSLFLYSLEPVAVPAEPLVARLMAETAEKANVGPMAAVAGKREILEPLSEEIIAGTLTNGQGVSVDYRGSAFLFSSQESRDTP